MDRWMVCSLSQSSHSDEHEQSHLQKCRQFSSPECWAKPEHWAFTLFSYSRGQAKLIPDAPSHDGGYSLGRLGVWKGVSGGAENSLSFDLVTWVCAVCENYQPVNIWFVRFSVCMLSFNNGLFFKTSEGKEPSEGARAGWARDAGGESAKRGALEVTERAYCKKEGGIGRRYQKVQEKACGCKTQSGPMIWWLTSERTVLKEQNPEKGGWSVSEMWAVQLGFQVAGPRREAERQTVAGRIFWESRPWFPWR